MGFIVDLITKEFDTVLKNYEELNQKITGFSFSEEGCNPNLLQVLSHVPSARISKIWGKDQKIGDLMEYIDYYEKYVTKIYIREDFFNPCFDHLKDTIDAFKASYGDKVEFLCNDVCSSNYFLVGDEIRINETKVKKLL